MDISNCPVEEFLPWVVKFHSENLVSTSHNVVNIVIRLDGERASSEAIVDGCLRYKGKNGLGDLVFAGRYLDKWERRAGVWRIVDRTAMLDRYRTEPVRQDSEVDPWVTDVTMGIRSVDDLSYRYV